MRTLTLFIGIFIIFIAGCNSVSKKFNMEKKYWDLDDYNAAIQEIKYNTPEDEKLPSLSDPETAAIFNKITDISNVAVVVEDSTLGISHRSEFASKMFDIYKDLFSTYEGLDKQDKYIYPAELVEIMNFGLYIQLHYFKLGNDNIIKNATNPNDSYTQSVIVSNSQSIVENYNIFVGFLSREDALNADAIQLYATGMDTYFPKLLKLFPTANYSEMSANVNRLLSIVKSQELKSSLSKLKVILDEKLTPAI